LENDGEENEKEASEMSEEVQVPDDQGAASRFA
jgi:hypothetical protein